MKFVDYSPEVTRLRRTAKACAAGEMSRTEYRARRREVLQDMIRQRLRCDDTVRRLAGDTTVRRDVDAVAPVELRPAPWPAVWLFAALAMLVLVALPSNALATSGFVIPPVKERDPNPQTAPRHGVTELVWQPEQSVPGFSEAGIAAFLNNELAVQRVAETPAGHGFNPRELQQVARFLDAVGIHDARTRLSIEDLRDLQALVSTQKQSRGLTVVQMEAVAANLQRLVRAKGYPLARAYVPSQRSNDGRVHLNVELGLLADVVVHSDSKLSAKRQQALAADVRGLLGEPVRQRGVETRLNLLNRASDHRLQADFKPGAGVGETAMVLRYRDNGRYRGEVGFDNHGLEAFGSERLTYRGSSSGLWRGADRLSVSLAATVDSQRSYTGGVRYAMPLAEHNLTLSSGLSISDAQWQNSSLGEVRGEGTLWFAQALKTDVYTRERRREYRFSAGLQQWDWSAADGSELLDQRVWFVGATLQGHRLWDQERIALHGQLQLTAGGLDGALDGASATGSGAGQSGQDKRYARLHGSAQAWTPWRWAAFDRTLKLVLSTRMQYSAASLPAAQRFALSGPDSNPGLAVGTAYTDSGIELGARVQVDVSGHELWLFMDHGYGENNADDTWMQLSTAGVGWQSTLWRDAARVLRSRLTVGYPLAHKSNGELDDDGAQIFFSLKLAH